MGLVVIALQLNLCASGMLQLKVVEGDVLQLTESSQGQFGVTLQLGKNLLDLEEDAGEMGERFVGLSVKFLV